MSPSPRRIIVESHELGPDRPGKDRKRANYQTTPEKLDPFRSVIAEHRSTPNFRTIPRLSPYGYRVHTAAEHFLQADTQNPFLVAPEYVKQTKNLPIAQYKMERTPRLVLLTYLLHALKTATSYRQQSFTHLFSVSWGRRAGVRADLLMFSHVVVFWTKNDRPSAADELIAGAEKYLKPI